MHGVVVQFGDSSSSPCIDDGLAWQFFFNDEGPQTQQLHVRA